MYIFFPKLEFVLIVVSPTKFNIVFSIAKFVCLLYISAVRRGDLPLLKWVRTQDPPCPWNWRVTDYARLDKHFDLVKWLRTQDPPCPWMDRTKAKAIAYLGEAEVASWFKE